MLRLDLRRLEKLRKLAASREEALLERLLREGIARGDFRADYAVDIRKFLVQVMLAMAVSVEARSDDAELWRAIESFAEFISERAGR